MSVRCNYRIYTSGLPSVLYAGFAKERFAKTSVTDQKESLTVDPVIDTLIM
jgi:hypothetical protein